MAAASSLALLNLDRPRRGLRRRAEAPWSLPSGLPIFMHPELSVSRRWLLT
jgi:hypothetical protein